MIMMVSEGKRYGKEKLNLFLYGEPKSAQVRNNPLWAAEIYSMARITLYKAMIGAHMLRYVDTDCIMADGSTDLEVGEQIGQWRKDMSTVSIYGAKQYKFGDKVIWKGVSNKSAKRNEIAFSLYTQERFINPIDGTTVPFSKKEIDNGTAARNHRDNGSNPNAMGDDNRSE
jgi:hypothetical protein